MLNVMYIQQAYIDLYTYLRNYIWSYDVVEKIANLEISVYKACPNIADIKHNLYELHSHIYPYFNKDEELKESYEAFEDMMDECDTTYIKLKSVNEVVSNDNQEKSATSKRKVKSIRRKI